MNKGKQILFVGATLVLLMLCAFAQADGAEVLSSGPFRYRLLEDGTAEITECISNAAELDVPDNFDGTTVTSIADHAFFSCRSLVSVTLPDSVTNVGADPFYGCIELKRIRISADQPALAVIDGVLFSKADKRLVSYPNTLRDSEYTVPNGIKCIGDNAFGSVRSLKRITLPDSVTTIGNEAFAFCESLTGIKLSSSLESIGDYAFSNCNSLTGIKLPESVKSIGNYAFTECKSLSSITLQEGLTSIGDYAFRYCHSLAPITIPNSVTSIGANPFICGNSQIAVEISKNHPALEMQDGVLFSKADNRLIYYPRRKQDSEYTVPRGVESIGDGAFCQSMWLERITLPDSVTSIGANAFRNCESLSSIILPGGVTDIGDWAFSDCFELNDITLPDGLKSIGIRAFQTCWSLTDLKLSDSVESIGLQAFQSCTKLTLTVARDSYAEQYAEEQNIPYVYPDTNDWLSE